MPAVYFAGCQSGPYLAIEFVFGGCSEPRNHTAGCDNDTLLAKVDSPGPACHTGNGSCFFKTVSEED